MKNILKKNESLRPPKLGEIIEGKVIAIEKSAIYVDLGPLGTGIIYGREFYEAKDILKDLKPGQKILAKIIEVKNEEGYVELSLSQAGKELAWEKLRHIKEKQETLTVKILGANKGGLLVNVFNIQAFLPVSQLAPEHYPRVEDGDQTKILRELQKFVSQELKVKILDLNPEQDKLILSEKAKEAEKFQEILKNYKLGDIVEGQITGIVDFGAFMKFPADSIDSKENLEGLVHISELDWQLIEDPSQIVKVGDKVKAKIVDISGDRISLSLKALKRDPWKNIEEKYKNGDVIKGEVIKFNPFGVFVKISPKIQGLVHISEFGTQKKMQETLKIGENYEFRILSIEPQEHKMILKLDKIV